MTIRLMQKMPTIIQYVNYIITIKEDLNVTG